MSAKFAAHETEKRLKLCLQNALTSYSGIMPEKPDINFIIIKTKPDNLINIR